MAGQNQAKFLEMFNYITKIVPQNAQANELNFEKIILGLLQASWYPKNFFEETLIIKELVLAILKL